MASSLSSSSKYSSSGKRSRSESAGEVWVENQSALQFILPGTHATIFPWIAPPIGLPVDVLIKMRSELFTIFHYVVSTHVTGRRSWSLDRCFSRSSASSEQQKQHFLFTPTGIFGDY